VKVCEKMQWSSDVAHDKTNGQADEVNFRSASTLRKRELIVVGPIKAERQTPSHHSSRTPEVLSPPMDCIQSFVHQPHSSSEAL
jgi:hypothetical protein